MDPSIDATLRSEFVAVAFDADRAIRRDGNLKPLPAKVECEPICLPMRREARPKTEPVAIDTQTGQALDEALPCAGVGRQMKSVGVIRGRGEIEVVPTGAGDEVRALVRFADISGDHGVRAVAERDSCTVRGS